MSPTDLPARIVAASTALARDLSAWSAAHPDCPLADAEAAMLQAVRAALPTLRERVLGQTHRARQTLPVHCPTCHHAVRVWDWRPRQVLSVCGRVQWERPWALGHRCHASFGAGDAALGLRAYQHCSDGLTTLLVRLGSTSSVRDAAHLLTATTGLVLSSETVRRVTEAAGAHAATEQDVRTAAYGAGGEPAGDQRAPGTLVVETEGVMVRYQDGWHEAKVGVVGGWETAQPDGHLQQASDVAAREERSAVAMRLGAEAARRGALTVVGWHGAHNGIAALRPVVVLGDGAKWIWEAAAAQFGARTEIIDYFHACEHLSTVAGLLYGAGSAAAARWARARREELRTQGVAGILPHLSPPAGLSAEATAQVRTERGYFSSNAARMAYPAFRARGLPIGSGAVASSAKHVVQHRLKRAGARWSPAGARALLALRAQQASCFGEAA